MIGLRVLGDVWFYNWNEELGLKEIPKDPNKFLCSIFFKRRKSFLSEIWPFMH